MLLTRLSPNGAGSDMQTFECAKCGYEKIVETEDHRNEKPRVPRSGDTYNRPD
jgi:hypothetical protein